MKKMILFVIALLIGIGGYSFYSNRSKPNSHQLNFHRAVKPGMGFENWTPIAPKDEQFKAAFPENPSLTTRNLPVPGSDLNIPFKEFKCTLNDEKHFTVSYITLPEPWLKYGKNLILGGALKVIMGEMGKVQLVGKEKAVFKTFSALDYEYYSQRDQTETAGTLVLVGNKLYKVEMVYPLHNHDHVQDELCNFIENFFPQHGSLATDIPQSQ
ncbi:MAG: hypothetical protein KDK60_02795 [Chlamydiia bacterium]|nr:hypothetical protein [Chlamydiia bacterium]